MENWCCYNSEASIANVMLHASPGFICLVDTPTLGFVVILAEDEISTQAVVTYTPCILRDSPSCAAFQMNLVL